MKKSAKGKSKSSSKSKGKKDLKNQKPKAPKIEVKSKQVIEDSEGSDQYSESIGVSEQQSMAKMEVIFNKGTYIAYIDPSESLESYKIGYLLEELREGVSEAFVDEFVEMAPLTFKLERKQQHVFEQFIICDVNVKLQKGKKKETILNLLNQQQNKVHKLMDAVVKQIQEDESEEDDEEGEDEEGEEEEEEEEEEEQMQIDTKEEIDKRVILKAKKHKDVSPLLQKRDTRSRSKIVQSQPVAAKKNKSVGRKGKEESKKEDEEMVVEIKEVKKAAKRGKSTQIVKAGMKRKNATSSKKKQNEDSGDESDEVPKKRRGLNDNVEKVVKKKVPKKPIVFKKGKWNPDIALVQEDKYIESTITQPFLDCCIRCNNKNVIRASVIDSEILLKKCLDQKKKISVLTAYQSAEIKSSSIMHMAKRNQHELLEILLHPKLIVKLHQTYDQERQSYYMDRIKTPQYLLNFVDSGMVNKMAYGGGRGVRKVQMTRGNRQGNNAFLQYEDNSNEYPNNDMIEPRVIKSIMIDSNVRVDTLQALYKLNPGVEDIFNSHIIDAVRAGNQLIAFEIVQRIVKFPNWGFNSLHSDVLNPETKVIEKVLKQSVLKKANTNRDLTPLHCACINPNTNILKQLLDMNPEVTAPDQDLKKPVHYAAACVSSAPLKLLLEQGANVGDVCNQKQTCLHVASMYGRPDNVRLILQTREQLLNNKDKKSMTAMGYACKYGHIEVVEVLLEFKAKINFGSGIERFPPLNWASAYGHLKLVQLLLEKKARVLSKDKFKRTALIMAVRNGHTKIASILLQAGSEWNHLDSSMNTPLHYAAAYGSLDCIDLLLSAGSDINAGNSWKISPINIAMLKNHTGAVKKLLEYPNIDVNCKDEKGKTLLMMALVTLDHESLEFIEYLLKKGADPNMADSKGNTALHYIAEYNPRNTRDVYNNQIILPKDLFEEQVKIQTSVATLLIDKGGDLSKKNNEKQTPFAICLQLDNAPLLKFLQFSVSLIREPELFFEFQTKIFNIEYQQILFQLMNNDPPSIERKQALNVLDENGYTPFLIYIEQFTKLIPQFQQSIQCRLNQQSIIHGTNVQSYSISNKDLFDQYADQKDWYTYNQSVPNNFKLQIGAKILKDIVVTPFIQFLMKFIQEGADCQSQVVKLKIYREEEEKRKLQFGQLQENQEKMKVDEEEKVKKREEILKEKRKKVKKNNRNMQNYQSQEEQTEKKGVVYEIRDGVKIEREYGPLGLRNAFHIIMDYPQSDLFELLINLNVNADSVDYDQVTPFNLLSRKGISDNSLQQEAFQRLLSLDVRIDYPDIKGRTPFLNFYEKSNYQRAYQMLQLGANVNQIDVSGMFAMKYALIRRHNAELQKLLDNYGNINQLDNRGRNLLHHAVNMSSATADASFETEQFLIEKGVDLNLRDDRGRTPLHYAFVKIHNWNATHQIDPIETVSSLCGCKGLEINVADKWLKTPLHYASQRGASICSVYLIKRNAMTEMKDIYGNTPLGVGLMSGHFNYGIILIEKGLSVKVPIFKEDHEKLRKQMEQQDELYKIHKKGEDINVQVANMNKPVKKTVAKKAHRMMFQSNNNQLVDDYYDEEDYYNEDDDEESDDDFQEQAFNQQNAFGLNVFQQKQPRQRMNNLFGHQQRQQDSQAIGQPIAQQSDLIKSQGDEGGVSMFKVAIRGGQQGLAYLILDNGYDLMLAMQDAMDEKKFMLVLTLLNRNPEDEIVQQKNSKGQSLFHILSMNAASCNNEHLKRIYDTLLKRGVDSKCKDNFGRNALHYSVISKSMNLVQMLLEVGSYNLNEIDIYGHSPLSLCLKGKNSSSLYYFDSTRDTIFTLLCKKGANVNIVYPESDFQPSFSEDEVEDLNYKRGDGNYKCTPLINAIRQQSDFVTVTRFNIMALLEYGAKFNVVDSDGRDILIYAIMQDNIQLVKWILENRQQALLNREVQDRIGKSAAHYVVNPVKYGSYENVQILRLLFENKIDLQKKDIYGKPPIHYAQEQESGVLLYELGSMLNINSVSLQNFKRAISSVSTSQWPQSRVDYEADSDMFMEEVKKKEELSLKQKENRVPVDSTGRFSECYEVYYEDEIPWDIYLTKVDLKNGIYGDYVFYKLQLLIDRNRDLYVVFTRWGRIGESGMNQRTPFINAEEAKKDFRSIFKSKTGNVFDEINQFVKIPKKYNIAKVNYCTIDFKDYLAPFDYEKVPKSQLQQEVFDLFEEISNVTMYQRAMSSFGVDTNVLPFSSIKKEALMTARGILMQIKDALDEDIELSKAGIKADYLKLTEVKERISELTSRYYEQVPLAQYKNSIAPPLSNYRVLQSQYDNLENLTNIEFASKVLLGALFKQRELNPVDYVYQALNLMIEPLEMGSPEFETINTYIGNTRNVDQQDNRLEIANIFKIQRKGEAEMIGAYKNLPNHFLLYHGSQLFNFLGILSQGLRIAPPEAPPTGYMFGKGVYFADMFDKSASYAQRGFKQQDSYLMLMCEVAVGNFKELYNATYVEKLENQYHSVKGVGKKGPGYKHTLVLPNGVQIPYGPVIDYFKNDQEKQRQMSLQHNEYIVYNNSQIRMRYLVQIKKKKNAA